MSAAGPPVLDVFCEDVTRRARHGHLTGHPEYAGEMARAFEVLARSGEPRQRHRRTKCNPVLLDADGTERRSALEGAVVALGQEQAPAVLRGRVVLALNYDALMAGVDSRALVQRGKQISATYPRVYRAEDFARRADRERTVQRHMQAWAEWEQGNAADQRLRAVFAAVQAREEPTILFIDHLHRILGGDWQHYPVDLAPVLKPLLHRRQIQLWGACTLAEYRIIERNASMQRCFQHVYLPSARALLK